MATSSDANRVLYLTASATTVVQAYTSVSWGRISRADNWNSINNFPMTGTLTPTAAHGGGTNYTIQRAVIWLTAPELFGDIDGDVVLRLRGSGSAGISVVKCDLTSSTPLTATDGANGYAPYIWAVSYTHLRAHET